MATTRLPSATYRVQLNKDFRFADVRNILDYLHELGISDLYMSPILASRKGSMHGYDVIDPTRIDPDLGSEEEFVLLQTELQNRGMGLLLDTVPNHMAASAENPWWMDVLENGPQSAYAAFFDIEWYPHAKSLEGRILLPVLGRPFGEALDAGEIKLIFQDGRFLFQYFESLFPLAPRSYYDVLNHRADKLKKALGEDAAPYHEYCGILASVQELFRADRRTLETAADRRLRFESARDRLKSLLAGSKEVTDLLEESVNDINGKAGDPGSFGFLQRLLGEQYYKLAFWQNLNESINYRRFFTIADLVGIRVEDPVVFEATHGLILRLVSKNPSAGLRIDHIDGLRDPYAYLSRLQERLSAEGNRAGNSSYVLVEKILARQESLPADWPVNGTTGYDYMNEANGLFVEPDGAKRIEEIYSTFIGRKQELGDVVYQKKKLVMSTLLGVEMRTLGRQLAELAARDRYARELDRGQLIDALIEVTACFAVYRTYIRNMELPANATKYIDEALIEARRRASHLKPACFDFVREVLLLLNGPHVLADQREARLAFVMRWQQFTGPIVAKGFEDTTLYVYHPLLSLNEVGGNPRPTDAASNEQFNSYLEDRLKHLPGTLNATTTHDTKRSEDVRARLNVLSEMPGEWKQHLECWAKLNQQYKRQVRGQAAPDSNEEYYLYQTLIGVWPLPQENSESLLNRIKDHLIKATREAMVHTRWTRPNEQHEEALQKFVEAVLSENNREFLDDFRQFQKRVAQFGMINGLSQTLLKITVPGVPDFYQGSELWDLRMVDPDNRGVIDFATRRTALEALANADNNDAGCAVCGLLDQWHDGRVKLYLIWKSIRFRRDHEDLFREGEFIPLKAEGARAKHVTAFLRRRESSWALIAIPKWLSQLASDDSRGTKEFDWQDTKLVLPADAPREWNSVITKKKLSLKNEEGGSTVRLQDLFREFPVAFNYSQTP